MNFKGIVGKERYPVTKKAGEVLRQLILRGVEKLTCKDVFDAGKTGDSLALAVLEQVYDCTVFHMDDYFLRPEQRTPQRLAEPGGNVDRERFLEEVLLPLTEGRPFTYRPFDCGTFQLTDPVSVMPKKLNIVEGTYSLHPYFRDVYDLKIRLTISPELQRQRVLERPEFLHQRFFEEWIPMENLYFEGFAISEKCHIIL